MKVLGGRLSDSGLRPGHVGDGPKATRMIDRGNAMNCMGLASPVAQHAAQADRQQSPTQFRSEAGGIPAAFHRACCNDADPADRSDSSTAAWNVT